ncbi:uncharacterized protein BJ171DRAFT_639973 [Polychytrium aggregatum]|uniref:uncharacterized protein n=1 Tax=Polychytrium aggregatum TaxID=110093 RepID=UPI0022FE3E1C|nr:uncharacterized protein BJ171DRAFT_639973 [Polychytrium aggregatum]KAI9207231.1 hypothetical protein BJ171DRAFT_639973 [Polychytrium aggregatum]
MSKVGLAKVKLKRLSEVIFSASLTEDTAGDSSSSSWASSSAGGQGSTPGGIEAEQPELAHFRESKEISVSKGDAGPGAAAVLPRTVNNATYTYITPEPLANPILIAVSESAAALLEVDSRDLCRRDSLDSMSMARPFTTEYNTRPWAHVYGGHQYGIYAGQLGDGRACSVGDIVNSEGETWELNIKGIGKTPMSRFGDGYATLRSSLREFLGSEFMAALSIPTTRSLYILGGTRPVYREKMEASGVLGRLCPTWVRFGSFELFWYRAEKERIRNLADHLIRHIFPYVIRPDEDNGEGPESSIIDSKQRLSIRTSVRMSTTNQKQASVTKSKNPALQNTVKIEVELNKYARLFREIVHRSAILVASWQAVGFCHGVMNTDNMSVAGFTMDYGPFGFMDSYDPFWVCNSSDRIGRYRFERQPRIMLWNLTKLGRTFVELIVSREDYADWIERQRMRGVKSYDSEYDFCVKGEEVVRELLREFEPAFFETYVALMRKKLGLRTARKDDMEVLVAPLLALLADTACDYTHFFRALCSFRTNEAAMRTQTTYDPESNNWRVGIKTPPLLLLINSAQKQRMVMKTGEPRQTPSVPQSAMAASMSGASQPATAQQTRPATRMTETSAAASELAPFTKTTPPEALQQIADSLDGPDGPDSPQTEANGAADRTSLDSNDGIPSINEIVDRWKEWARLYQSRLVEEGPDTAGGKSVGSMDMEDIHRMKRMRQVNPRYTLRNWILDEVIEACCSKPNLQPISPTKRRGGRLQTATASLDAPPPMTPNNEFPELERIMRVMLQDLYGDVAESSTGWKNPEDKAAADRWAGEVPWGNANSQVGCLS